MSDVEFDGDKIMTNRYVSHTIIGAAQVPGLTNLIIKTGLAKSQKAAFYWMVWVIVIALGVAIGLLAWYYYHGSSRAIPYQTMTAAQRAAVPQREQAYIKRHVIFN